MNENKTIPWLFLTPALCLFLLIFAYPLVMVVATSFTEWEFLGTPQFNGIRNYIRFFRDPDTRQAFANTLAWIALQSTVHVWFGLMVALFLHRKPFYWKFIRSVVMIPNIISIAALGLIMLLIFHPSIGPINGVVRLFGRSDFAQNWFFDPSTAFRTVTLTWLFYAGIIVVLLLTEMASIPQDYYEAAVIDGAGAFHRTFKITIPLLRNMLGTCTLLAATSRLTDFAMILLTTNGGPGTRTTTLPLLVYKKISLDMDWGMANTIGTVIILMGLVLILIINRLFGLGGEEA